MYFILGALLLHASSSSVLVTPGAGYPAQAYAHIEESLEQMLSSQNLQADGHVCLAHSQDGARYLLEGVISSEKLCSHVVLYGASPSLEQLAQLHAVPPMLVISGSLDGVNTLSQFAVSRHRNSLHGNPQFIVLPGGSHHSIVGEDSPHSPLVVSHDLKASLTPTEAQSQLLKLMARFLSGDSLSSWQQETRLLLDPIVIALQLEGSTNLGEPACNSDYPTNLACRYPKWPDHALPPGPAPAPSPPISSSCVCGSPWVMQTASPLIAGLYFSPNPDATVIANDAFHDVSDTHPFHLPHIFNQCQENSSSCGLNISTVTMPVLKAGPLFPDNATIQSAYELKTKLKSRQATWEKAGFGKGSGALDKNTSMCMTVNQNAYDWAMAFAAPDVRKRFEQEGEPYVMVPDKEAPIGITGPTWIKKELEYNRVKNKDGKSQIEIQSWSFIVSNTNQVACLSLKLMVGPQTTVYA